MTWSANFGGHYQRQDGTWDAALEQEIAAVFHDVIEKLKSYGVATAIFNGNHYQENFLAPKEESA